MNNIITIVAPAHYEPIHDRVFIQSMLCQTEKNKWEAVICHNGTNDEMMQDICNLNKKKFEFWCSPEDSGNWGTKNRQKCIDECNTEYILQTSISDYWLPQAMEYILKTIERMSPDLIIWDSINHLVGPCKILESKLEWAKIDWGNFAIRTDIAKQIKIKQTEYCADWLFIQDVLNSGLVDEKKIIKLPYILTIHN